MSKNQKLKTQEQQYLRGSLITHQTRRSRLYRILTVIDFFAFIPVPKDRPVSTKASMLGSILFVLVAIAYTVVTFYFFVTDNPPSIETYYVKLDRQFYQLPKIAVAFMNGTLLNDTGLYDQYFNFTFTKQLKSINKKLQTQVQTQLNDPENTYWLTQQITQAYPIRRSPAEPMLAKGLLYSSNQCNYTKLLISMCDINNPNNTCASINQIRSLTAKGRVFLFIEDQKNNISVSKQNDQNENKFILTNFFLEPGRYKRATLSFKIVNTQVFPDYLNRFSNQYSTRLVLDFVSQQSSNTSINDEQKGQNSLQMLGITFILSPQVQNVRITYLNILDYISKWGAFINVIFTVFALVLLRFNKNKFYDKNPQWDEFRRITNKKLKLSQSRT